ncbi:MAG: acyltransferase, partial [Burkholderiaceae bacterium]|nr:acyltransferase [Burkholderiaceae bacterium]
GLAVLSLLAMHLFPNWSRGGGLVGFDMFFVISGYLISDCVLRAHAEGRFSLMAFYARRIQRIVPSLCLVLLFCLAFSWLFTFPGEVLQIGKHAAAAALFASNFVQWFEATPSDLGFTGAPLFHLWALALEVQFCIVWPICLLWLLRRGLSVAAGVCALLVASLAWNIAIVESDPNAAFLLPASRTWELMVGALLACMSQRNSPGLVGWIQARCAHRPLARQWTPDLMAGSGVALLLLSLALIDSTRHFPGWWALLPTAGTFALLAAGPEARINRHLLSQPILRFYGAISYPLYLWHWPLLSFPIVLGVPLTHELRVIILIASVVLAALTYEVVDRRLRASQHAGASGLAASLLAALLVIALIGYGFHQTGGASSTFPPSLRGGPAVEMR